MDVWVGIAIIVGAAIVVGLLRWVGHGVKWVIEVLSEAIAKKLILAINGQLGLEALRVDVAELKRQMEIVIAERLDD